MFITANFQDINIQGLFMLKFYDNIVTIEQSIILYLKFCESSVPRKFPNMQQILD